MKINYFGYSIEDSAGKKYLTDIRPFLHAFCEFAPPAFKDRFTHNNEHVFLLSQNQNFFLFLMTRNNEIIKSIKRNDHTLSEIYDRLDADESLGFASYVYIESSFFGYASTSMAPKDQAFVTFINNIFKELRLGYKFIGHPMLQQSSRQEIMTVPFLGRATIQVSKENSMFEDIRDLIKCSVDEFTDVDSIEVTIKPRHRKNIEPVVKKMIHSISDHGLDKMVVKAKQEIHDNLIDLYLAGRGIVSDPLDRENEKNFYHEISQKAASNETLGLKVKAHENDDAFTKKEIDSLSAYHDKPAWDSVMDNL